MARIFSIQFFYDGILQNAMITVRETPFHSEYKISMLDNDLMLQLLSDKIISTSKSNFAFANVLVQNYNDLMREIIKAISLHVHSLQH